MSFPWTKPGVEGGKKQGERRKKIMNKDEARRKEGISEKRDAQRGRRKEVKK